MNSRHKDYDSSALTPELHRRDKGFKCFTAYALNCQEDKTQKNAPKNGASFDLIKDRAETTTPQILSHISRPVHQAKPYLSRYDYA